jgi:hypothetical protein
VSKGEEFEQGASLTLGRFDGDKNGLNVKKELCYKREDSMVALLAQFNDPRGQKKKKEEAEVRAN